MADRTICTLVVTPWLRRSGVRRGRVVWLQKQLRVGAASPLCHSTRGLGGRRQDSSRWQRHPSGMPANKLVVIYSPGAVAGKREKSECQRRRTYLVACLGINQHSLRRGGGAEPSQPALRQKQSRWFRDNWQESEQLLPHLLPLFPQHSAAARRQCGRGKHKLGARKRGVGWQCLPWAVKSNHSSLWRRALAILRESENLPLGAPLGVFVTFLQPIEIE